jgi:hypothetical protein
MKSDWTVTLLASNGHIRELPRLFHGHCDPRVRPFSCLRVNPPSPDFALIDFVSQSPSRHAYARHCAFLCFRQLDLAPFDFLFWPHPLVIHHSAPGRSEALRRP